MRSAAFRLADFGPPLIASLAFAAIVAWHGIPALRHDWEWPVDRSSLLDLLTRSASGWDPRGIGSPNLYINDYLISGAIAVLVYVLGGHSGLFAFMFAIGGVCAFGASALARSFGAEAVGRAAVALFVLFNPWAYAETVAGHSYMLLAYGATIALLAEYRREKPRPIAAALLAVLTLQQLQFFVVALIVTAVGAVRRSGWLPLSSALVAGSPTIANIALELWAYRGVPFTLAWESVQSVAPASALLLSGYYAGYTQQIDRLDQWIMPIVAGLSIYGLATIARTRWGAAAGAFTVACVTAAMGLRGPLSAFERFTMTRIPESLLFRELFDLLGLAAVGYAVGMSAFAARRGGFARIALASSAALACAWLAWSPWAWWVSAADRPSPEVDAAAGTRYALFPAFQPLARRSDGAGSGLDPDARILPGDVAPVNTMLPEYPVDAALAAFETSGETRQLAALGVSEIIGRPWLTSDVTALLSQRALPPVAGDARRSISLDIVPQPEFSVFPPPRVCSVCENVGAGAVFFGDVAGLAGPGVPEAWAHYRSVMPVRPSDSAVLAQDGWVDARLAFASVPELAQAFGGAVTIASGPALPVTGGLDALVFVRGRLLTEDGRVVAASTYGYRWVSLASDVDALRCDGLCVVALEAIVPNTIAPEIAPQSTPIAVSTDRHGPWLASAHVPPGDEAMLVFDSAYDPGWLARMGGQWLTHVRVDAATNGWLLPARESKANVDLVEWPSAVEAGCEVIGLAWTLGLIGGAIASAMRRRPKTL
jgi:hypothetical protein